MPRSPKFALLTSAMHMAWTFAMSVGGWKAVTCIPSAVYNTGSGASPRAQDSVEAAVAASLRLFSTPARRIRARRLADLIRPGLDASQSTEGAPGPGAARWIGSTGRVASRSERERVRAPVHALRTAPRASLPAAMQTTPGRSWTEAPSELVTDALGAPIASNQDHDERAALVCLLTAAAVAKGVIHRCRRFSRRLLLLASVSVMGNLGSAVRLPRSRAMSRANYGSAVSVSADAQPK